jgi:hypothetical protein
MVSPADCDTYHHPFNWREQVRFDWSVDHGTNPPVIMNVKLSRMSLKTLVGNVAIEHRNKLINSGHDMLAESCVISSDTY